MIMALWQCFFLEVFILEIYTKIFTREMICLEFVDGEAGVWMDKIMS